MAKAQSAQALETLRLQAEGQKAMAAMGNDDKERAHKQALQALELDYKTQSDAATRDQNDRATTMATALEDQQLKSAERIAAGNMQAQIERDQAAQQHALELQRLRDTAAAQNLVLAKGLETGAVVQEGPQLVDVIQPLIAEMQASNAAMVQRFQEGFQTLHASHRAPRTARYIKDENGKNIGVESVENPVL